MRFGTLKCQDESGIVGKYFRNVVELGQSQGQNR